MVSHAYIDIDKNELKAKKKKLKNPEANAQNMKHF